MLSSGVPLLCAAVIAIVAALHILCILLIRQRWSLRNRQSTDQKQRKRIAFVHLDLGIGGAERLVVDAACALQLRGHEVKIFTSNHPRAHCFPETLDVLRVEQHGHFLPRHIFRRFQIVCSIVRMSYVAWKVVLFADPVDILFCDGVSGCIPILKLSTAKVLFYCHYPDLLLIRKKWLLQSLYRLPMDVFEEITTAMADNILVNSEFTQSVFKKTFPHIQATPVVVYPTVNVANFDQLLSAASTLRVPSEKILFLSLNRFDPAKQVELAVNAFVDLYQRPQFAKLQRNLQLVLAGGYDPSVRANVDYLKHLQSLIPSSLHYETIPGSSLTEWPEISPIVFILDISEKHKIDLLKSATVLVYTPSHEHFGIVPVEAMVASCAVIAVNNGGPLETVGTDEQVGFLCPAESKAFADKFAALASDQKRAKEMGRKGRQRAIEHFSFTKMANQLDEIVAELCDGPKKIK